MRKKIFLLFLFSSFIFLSFRPDLISAIGRYRPGDWVSYTVLRYVTSVAKDLNYIYFGTTGGVSRYDWIREKWEKPFTTSDGIWDNRVKRIAYDPDRDELWFDTYSGTSMYQRTFEEWYSGGIFPDNLVKKDSPDSLPPQFFMEYGYTYFQGGYIMDLNLNRYEITSALKDDWENLWIGTWGLNAGRGYLRYLDLHMFKYGLYDSDVKAVLLDGETMWFAGTGDFYKSTGITRYNRKEDLWDYFEDRYLPGLCSNAVNVMEKDSTYVWFGTADGLARYNKKRNIWRSFTVFKGLRDNYITALKSDDEVLWIGTRVGLNFYWFKRDSIGTIPDNLVKGAYIYAIEADKNYVWVGTDFGVLRMGKKTGEWLRFNTPEGILSGKITSITKNGDELWFASSYGLLGFNISTNQKEALSSQFDFPGKYANQVLADSENIWVSTDIGVWKMDRKTKDWRNFTKVDGLLDDQVQCMLLDGDYIWLGTPKGATKFFWNNPLRID
jgi:ligand-binding sensor domain-containing protein